MLISQSTFNYTLQASVIFLLLPAKSEEWINFFSHVPEIQSHKIWSEPGVCVLIWCSFHVLLTKKYFETETTVTRWSSPWYLILVWRSEWVWSSYLILTTIRYQLSSTVAPVIIMTTKTSQISGCVCVREKSRLKFKNILTQRDFSFISLSAGLRCLKTNKRRMLFHCCCVVSLWFLF